MPFGKRFLVQWFSGLLFYLNWEIVGGAIVWHILAGKVLGHASTPRFQYLLLGCAVFFIYGLDRLLDVRSIINAQLTTRQNFYKRFKPFVVAMLVLSLGLGGYLFFNHISLELITRGGIILSISLLYLILRHLNILSGVARESFVAVVFTIAIWGYQIIPKQIPTWHEVLLCTSFVLTCMANLLLISWREVKSDYEQDNPSAALVMGVPRLRFHALICMLLAMILALTAFWISPIAIVDICASVLIIHNLAHYFLRTRFIKHVAIFRFVIDSLFLLPALTLL